MTEYSTDHTMWGIKTISLPIRTMIPIVYNTIRLLYLWPIMMMSSATIVYASQGLLPLGTGILYRALHTSVVINFVYTFLHLIGFLLPIASYQYLRTYFYYVAAHQVILKQ